MEPPSTVTVHLLNTSGRRAPAARLRSFLAHVLGSEKSVELLLTNDRQIQELNKSGRGVDEPTDVLTFPAPQFSGAPWGEIVISVDYAERQARERRISLSDELCYLALHGALHLVGYDDIADSDREMMLAEMHRIGLELGLPEQREWATLKVAS